MANKTVVFTNYFLNGTSGLTLLLLDPETAAIGNGAGDTLTAGSNGLFSAVVTEAITGWWNIVVLQGAVVVLEGGKVYFQSNAAGTYQVDDATHAADAVLDEPYADHNIAGTIGKLLNTIRKSNLAIDGVVSNAITPTTLTFSSNVSATTSAYAHAVLLFVSGPLTGENSPIISYNNTNGVFLLEEPLTAAPSDGDEFVVIANSHVHAISDIQSGLATSSGLANAFTEIKGVNWSSTTDTLKKIAEHANDPLNEDDIATLVFQALVGSAVARSALPTSATPLETLKYTDYDLDITASTAASSKLVVSIGCENHSNPNIEIDNETGLLRLNAKTDFQAAWATLTRVSPTLVRVHINAIAMKELVVGEYLLELREITVDDKVILRREYQFFVRSGAGRIID